MAGKPSSLSFWRRLFPGAAAGRGGAASDPAGDGRFRSLVEGASQGILVHRDFKPLFANGACAQSLGYATPEEVVKLGSLKAILPPRAERRLRDLAGAGVASSPCEVEALCKDGSTVWTEWRCGVVDWEGRPAIQAVISDIGERKRAEEEIRRAHAHLETLVDSMEDGVFMVKDGAVAFANRNLAERLGYAVEEMIGRPIADFLSPDSRERTVALHDRRLAGDTAEERHEVELLCRDGRTTVPVVLNATRVTGPDGQVLVLGTARDITARRRAEAALRDSEEQFKALLDNSPQSLNLKDAEGRYLLVNPEWERQHAVGAREALGRTSREVFGEETGERLAGTELEVIATGETRTFEATVLLPDGRRRTRLITKFPVRDRNGAITRIGTVGMDITERTMMEEALRDSEEKFHTLMDNSPLTINLKQADGRFLMVNREFERHHGLRLAEAVGRTARELFGEESAKAIEAADAKVLATGITTTFEVEFRLANGNRTTHLATKFPIRDSRGAITRLGTIGMDISDRKRMERAILESEERFREFAESSSDWLWETDAESRLTFVSGRIKDLLGIDPAEIVGRKQEDFAAAGQDSLWRDLEEVLRARRPIRDFRYEAVDNLGQRHWLSIGGRPRYASTGEFLGYRGTGTDITETTLALHREARVQERFLAAIETVPVAVALFDAEDRLVVANERYRARLAVAVKLRPGMPFEEILRIEVDADAIVEAEKDRESWFRERMARHRNPTGSFEVHRVNGWFQVREHRAPDGYTLVVVHDITDQKRAEQGLLAARDELEARVRERTQALEQEILERHYAEQALQQANQELERRVEERTRHLSEEIAERKKLEAQFLQAQKMEAIGQLAGGIAHDFNNLLTVIQGNLSWLKDKVQTDDDTVAQLMGMALEAARRAGELTHRMLAFSRRQDLRPERVDLPRVLDSIAPLVARALSESVTLEIGTDSETWPVMVDPHQLESAILNIALNARDAMPHGGTFFLKVENRVVDASLAARHDPVEAGDYVCLAMCDSGTGMPPEVLARAFDPFFTTKEVGKGSGLGLSMVFGFANQSGGFAEISSEPGEGTTVELYLPRCPREEAVASVPAAESHEPSVLTADLTVLVVEDDPLVRGVALEYLRMAGFKSIQADDGRSALDIMETTAPIDLVLSDIIMPGGISGLDLAERVRERWPDTAVLLMSGYSYEEFSRRGIDPDDFGVLRKPFTKRELLRKIRETVAAGPASP